MQNSPGARISLQNIYLSYPPRVVLRDLLLQVQSGEVFGILGTIGSGKTRILRLIAGLEKAERGTVLCHGSLGFVFQNDVLVPWLSVEQNLELCWRENRGSLADHPLVKETGVANWLDKKPFQLSGGMRKKVVLVRGFLNDPSVVLLDEPFGALDPAQKMHLQQVCLRLIERAQTTAVLVTHDIAEALQMCDRIGFLSVGTGQIQEVFANPFRGRFDESELQADPEYRRLFKRALDFYAAERGLV